MGKNDTKDTVDAAAKKQQRNARLKTGITVIITIGICCWVVYGLFNPKMTMCYNDFAIDSTVSWLENADRQDFDVCRKNSVDSDGWFDWFMKDRKSLGKVKSRNLTVRQELLDAATGMKRYELKFDSQFSKFSPKGNVSEKMIIETDGRSQFKALSADYWFANGFDFSGLTVTEEEKTRIMKVAEDALKKVDARDIAFFKQIYTEWSQQPDYFQWNNRFPVEAKTKVVSNLCDVLAKGKSSPRKFTKLDTYIPVGRTGFQCSAVSYSFSVTTKDKTQKFMLRIFVDRDLYQDKSAGWKFNALWFREQK